MTDSGTVGAIVDTHIHFWTAPAGSTSEMGDAVSYDDLASAMDQVGIAHALCVTPRLMGFNNSYSLEGAATHPERFRVLGRFDHTKDDLEQRLATCVSNPLMVGVRMSFASTDGWQSDANVNGFWDTAERLNIAVALYAPHQPTAVAEVAERHPGLRLIVDHLTLRHSDPASAFDQWAAVLQLARYPNISVKVSGLIEACHQPYPFTKAVDYLRQAFDAFGNRRVMWGSNYPPSLKACTYIENLALVLELATFLTGEDRAMMLSGNANRVFDLRW